jgi:hypothetical protein
VANWATLAGVGNPLAPGWQQQNLTTIEPVPGQYFSVYKPAAASFEGFLRELAATGYPLRSSGGFNYRTIRNSSKLSQHAFGNAIDINAAQNPMLARGQAVQTDLPPGVGDMAARYNLEWGGTWKRPDAMHFEWKGGNVAPPTAELPPQSLSGIGSPVAQPYPGVNPPAPPDVDISQRPMTPERFFEMMAAGQNPLRMMVFRGIGNLLAGV